MSAIKENMVIFSIFWQLIGLKEPEQELRATGCTPTAPQQGKQTLLSCVEKYLQRVQHEIRSDLVMAGWKKANY